MYDKTVTEPLIEAMISDQILYASDHGNVRSPSELADRFQELMRVQSLYLAQVANDRMTPELIAEATK